MKQSTKVIAFYLPQFHAIPENDKWWGENFTEWTNVKAGKPLFKGHYQPKVPLNKYYYNLLDKDTIKWQAELAKAHGLYGFCYYHYWFKNGKKLLEKPAEIMLSNNDIDIPFCFCWANENWARTWDGGNNEVIMPQEYGDESDWKQHLEYLVQFFMDERYIKINGKPLLVLYRPDIIPSLNKMLLYWKKEVKKYGFSDLVIMSQHPSGYFSTRYNTSNIDKFIMFEPQFTRTILGGKSIIAVKRKRYIFNIMRKVGLLRLVNQKYIKKKNSRVLQNDQAEINDYDIYWNSILNRRITDNRLVLGAFVNWDNIARKKNGMLFKGASPEKFKRYFRRLIDKNEELDSEFIFINAWNEWGEGAYLEPDELNGYSYLNALASALGKE